MQRRHPLHGLASPARCIGAPLILAAAVAGAIAQAQTAATWITLGPPGGRVSALLVDPAAPATVYAGTPQNGLFVSTDGGATWAAANAGLAPVAVGRQMLREVHALAGDGQFVYAASEGGLFRTAIGAAPSWSAVAATGAGSPVTMLANDPASGWLVAASPAADGVSTPGVYVATGPVGASSTWTFVALPAAAAGLGIDGIAIGPANGAVASTLLVSAGAHVYSAPLSAGFPTAPGWADADPSATLGAGNVSALAYSPAFLEALACSAGSLWASGNPLAATPLWTQATLPAAMVAPACQAIATLPVAAGGAPQAVLGTDQGVFVSFDGASFASTASLGTATSAQAFAIGRPPGAGAALLYVGTDFGIATAPVASVGPASGWSASNGPASMPTGAANLRLDNASIVDSAVLGTRLFAAAQDTGVAEVFASVDGGASWTPTGLGTAIGAGESLIELLADSTNGVLYAATTRGLWALDPAVGSWAAVGSSVITARVGALALGADAVFAGTDDGVFALPRTHAPAQAVPVAAGLAGSSVRSLLATPSVLIAGTVDANDDNFVFVTAETGAALGSGLWQPFGVGSAGTSRITSLLMVGTTLLASTNGNLVLAASANSNWTAANSPGGAAQQIADPFGSVTSLLSDGTTIFAATGSQGVFTSPVGTSLAWTPYVGSGPTALPALEVRRLRAGDGVVYASTRAGLARVADAALSPTPPASSPASAPAGNSGGGWAAPWWLLALLIAGAALRRRRPR